MGDHSFERLRRDTEKRLEQLHSRILSNLVMLGQIPSPTGSEQQRAVYLMDHFTALGLQEVVQDSAGNLTALWPGTEGNKTIALFAGMDTIFPAEVDHHYDVTAERVTGPGVSYDSLAASALASLAEYFAEADLRLNEDLLFCGLARCADQADQEGMRSFLCTPLAKKIDAALILESINLGRLSYFSLGALRFDLTIEFAHKAAWPGGIGRCSAIEILADAVNLLLSIELPRHPKASLNLGVIEGGEGHEVWAVKASLGAEIRSESEEVLARVEEEVDDIALHLSSYYNCQARVRKFGRRTTGGLRFSHPLVRSIRRLMHDLGITPAPGPDTMAGSLAMAAKIPTVALGISRGRRAGRDSYIEVEPIRLGLLQAILALHQMGDLLE